jgi:hypothetical protein
MEEDGILGGGCFGERSHLDLDAGLLQPFSSSRGDRIGIPQRGNHSPDTRVNDGLGTGRLLPLMRAGLEGDNHRRPSSPLTRAGQCYCFGVAISEFRVPSFSNQLALLQDHRSNQRIRLDPPPTSPGELEGSAHGLPLVHTR